MEQTVPARFADLKREIASTQPDFERRVTKAWSEIIGELQKRTIDIVRDGPSYIPQISFNDLNTLKPEELAAIKRKGCIVIKDVVDDAEATSWKGSLEQFLDSNPNVDGFPEDNKQFFRLYWTKAQILARSHPNVLTASVWLNKLYHFKSGADSDDINLSIPLSYADCFRIRHPGGLWDKFPPHVDGGSIERWEDPDFRVSFADILTGDWRQHDPFSLDGRSNAKTNIYNRPNQSTVFRTFQGWMALSETGPTQGTLKVFPDVLLSNSYLILRPFFRFVAKGESSEDVLDAKNWEFDLSSPEFPGIYPLGSGFHGPRPTADKHPHLRLDEAMTSIPKVNPGDMVFWHCDVIHAVEEEHTGTEDSAVMYIPAVPWTPKNADYLQRQKECFLKGDVPPDYPKGDTEANFKGVGKEEDIVGLLGREAMGLSGQVA